MGYVSSRPNIKAISKLPNDIDHHFNENRSCKTDDTRQRRQKYGDVR